MPLAPPLLTDGDDRFYKMVTRLRPSQLGAGEVALSQNGRMDVDGVWKCREGYENISGVVLTTTDRAILQESDTDGALVLIGSTSSATAAYTSSTGLVTVTTSAAHGLPSGHTSLINLASFTAAGSGPDIDGNRVVARTGATTFTFTTTTGLGDDTYTGGVVGSFKLSGDAVAIRGGCLFSDPDDSNEDYIVIADNSQATAIKISDLSKTTIAFPTGESLSQDCDIVQEFDILVLRQKGKTSWYFDPDDGTYGFSPGTPTWIKFSTGTATAAKVYTAATNTEILAGVVTVTEATHGRSVGDVIKVVSSSLVGLTNGDEYQVATVPGAGSFTFYADADDTASAQTVVYSSKVSLGGGFTNMPGAAWGVYHQRRSWVPYNYDSASTPAHRGIEDEVIASDFLSHVYDPIANQFRIAGGTADHTVALHGFDDDRLVVFNRNSIHYIKGVSGALTDTSVIQLTNEIGCLARKSVVSYANQILFLSDNGVYAISFLDEYNLRGTDIPLSEAVDSYIHRITPNAADKAVAVYHDNRYWIAIPIDGSLIPNVTLVYSFLNQGWESVDTTNASNWGIIDLIQARSGKVNALFAVTQEGGVHKLDGTCRARDKIAAEAGQSAETVLDIPAEVTTRSYTFGDLRRKKFQKLRVHFKSDTDYLSQGDLSFIVEDPDATVDMGEIRDEFTSGLAAGEDGTLHKRIGNQRGFAGQFRFVVESGRPAVRAVQVDGVGSYESTTSVS